MKTTRQSCSFSVSWLVSSNICPLFTGALRRSNAPFALTCSVCASSWKGSLLGPCPYTYTETSSDQRRLRRRSGISTAPSTGAFGWSLPSRTRCAFFIASKIRLIFLPDGPRWNSLKSPSNAHRTQPLLFGLRFEYITPRTRQRKSNRISVNRPAVARRATRLHCCSSRTAPVRIFLFKRSTAAVEIVLHSRNSCRWRTVSISPAFLSSRE